jgi:hypothetical protein
MTLGIGIFSLYVVLFALFLGSSLLIISTPFLASELDRAAGMLTYVAHAFFVASLATIGGALGASLESDQSIREAAYASTGDNEPRRHRSSDWVDANGADASPRRATR